MNIVIIPRNQNFVKDQALTLMSPLLLLRAAVFGLLEHNKKTYAVVIAKVSPDNIIHRDY